MFNWLQVLDSREISGAPGGTRTPDLLVRSQTLYPTELRARPWQLQYLTLLTRRLQVPNRARFWSILEQHKEHRIRRRLFPLLEVSVLIPHPCGNRVPTSSAVCVPSKVIDVLLHRFPRSHVFLNLRKACQPMPGSSSPIALRRSVSQRDSRLLCR